MKRVLVLSIVLLSACSNDDGTEQQGNNVADASNDAATNNVIAQDVRLPAFSPGNGCLPEDNQAELSGGDLVAMTDRIVVVDVTQVGIADSFAEASSLEDGLTRCDKVAVSLTLKVHASVVEILHLIGEVLIFMIGAGQTLNWASQPRYLFNELWLPDESAFNGEPEPQILTSAELGWTGDTGLQAGQRLVLFLNDNGGLTPTVFPMGEVGDDGVISFQGLDLPSTCLSLPASFQGMTVEALKAALLEPTDRGAFPYPASTSNFCAEALK